MESAAYVRVSTPQQGHDLQVAALQRAAAARGDTIAPGSIYSETMTGTKVERPVLRQLRQDARQGRLPRRLYVFALDRLTRTGIVDTIALLRELHGLGVEVISYSESFDLAGPTAEVVIAVMAWAAQQEVRRQGERRAAARARMEAEGRSWGAPPRVPPGDPRRARALELDAQGKSIREIAQHTGIPRTTVARYIAEAKKRPPHPPLAEGAEPLPG